MPSSFPSLIVDLDIVRSNLAHMSAKAERAGVEFRPHFKTHQSRQIGRMFKEYGVKGITVSSPQMARYFVDDGWTDITIAFPANLLAAGYYHQLASQCDLKTLVISAEVVKKLDKLMTEKMGLYIEIDANYGRSGIPVSDKDGIETVFTEIQESEHFYPAGFYCHAGQSYQARSADEVQDIAGSVLQKLDGLKQQWPDFSICFGDTPSCSVLEDFGPADQISPGNFVFYDWMQVQIGSCTPNEIAVYMECPIIEKFEDRKQFLIHGGAVHFSKDFVEIDDYKSFGKPRLKHLSKQTYLKSLSQEHGLVQCSADVLKKIKVGETLQVFPVHSCLTANLMGAYHTTDGTVLDHMSGFRGDLGIS